MVQSSRHPLVYVAWSVLILAGVLTGLVFHRLWLLRGEVEELASQLVLDAGPESTLIYDEDDAMVSALFEQHRIAVTLSEMSPHVPAAVIAVEDRRFFSHSGIDVRRIVKAGLVDLKARAIVQGASTITQQLVRSLLLNRERSFTRKFKEALLARRLEERYSKEAILTAYLNRVYFGDGYYGIEAAAIGYFGKRSSQLDVAEAATLAGLIKGPSFYSPTKYPDRARKRRDLVLREMRDQRTLAEADYQTALVVPLHASSLTKADRIGVADPRHTRGAEYFRHAVQRELLERFGAEAVYTGGLRVYTTLDRTLQQLAEEAVARRAQEMTSARSTEPLQGALVAIDPSTGFVKAIVGGRAFEESPFNRALDAKRQPGSAFKPFVFAAALESGYWPSSELEGLDEPIATPEGPWLPGGEHEGASSRLRDALVVSSNRAAAHLLQQVGMRRTLDLVTRFGIRSPMPSVPSVALGTGEVTLFELTSAYGVFANRGTWREPSTIRRVVDRYGREIYRASTASRPVISEATAYLRTSMMADVVDRGTAVTARSAGFTRQAAGKTGTSADYTDAWFVGYTPALVTGVWFGFDRPHAIMDRGFAGVVAVPAWARFMAAATRRDRPDWFALPGSLEKVTLCRISGMRATDRCRLPVAEPAEYDPNVASTGEARWVLREGGVYDELRPVGSFMDLCPLNHGWMPPDAVPTSLELPTMPGGTLPLDTTIDTRMPPPPPESERTPIVPGSRFVRPADDPDAVPVRPPPFNPVVPGMPFSTDAVPPRVPGNRPPPR